MNGNKSKFDYDCFYDDWEGILYFVVNQSKYSQKEARTLFETELGKPIVSITTGAVRYGAWRDENNKKRGCWRLYFDSASEKPRMCPVWILQ